MNLYHHPVVTTCLVVPTIKAKPFVGCAHASLAGTPFAMNAAFTVAYVTNVSFGANFSALAAVRSLTAPLISLSNLVL